MPARLVIRLRADEALCWLKIDERGRVIAGPLDGAPTPDALAGAEAIVVLAPGADVLVARTQVAARTREQLERAIPFALEEQLAEPVEALHFAHAPLPGDAGQLVVAVRRDRLRSWLAALERGAIRPDAIVADVTALPIADDAVAVLVEREASRAQGSAGATDGQDVRVSRAQGSAGATAATGHALIRAGAADCSVVEIGQLAEWLVLAAASRGAGTLAVALHDPDGIAPKLPPRCVARKVDAGASALEVLARGASSPLAVNLLGGEFAPAHRNAPVKKLWRRAALLAGALAAAWLAVAIGEYAVLSRKLDRLQREQVDVYRSVFPDARNIPNPAGQMHAQLDRAQNANIGGGGLELLRRMAPVLTGNTLYSVKSVDYRNGTLEVALVADSVATLDSVRERAAGQPGLAVTLTAVNSGPAGTEGRLRVQGAAP